MPWNPSAGFQTATRMPTRMSSAQQAWQAQQARQQQQALGGYQKMHPTATAQDYALSFQSPTYSGMQRDQATGTYSPITPDSTGNAALGYYAAHPNQQSQVYGQFYQPWMHMGGTFNPTTQQWSGGTAAQQQPGGLFKTMGIRYPS